MQKNYIVALLALLVATPALIAQKPDEALQLRTVVLQAIQRDAPMRAMILASDADDDAVLAQRLADVFGVRSRHIARGEKLKAAGADTVTVLIKIDSVGQTRASGTVRAWGALQAKKPYDPTVWFTTRRIEATKKGATWIVTKLSTTFES